jgi:thiamine biosynthesis lipoprotein
MGTKFRIVLYAPDQQAADKAATDGFKRVAEINDILSDYKPTSETMQLVKKFEREIVEPVRVSPELAFVLAKSIEASKLSEGAFDVTVRPLVSLWRQARRTQKLPDQKELAVARKLVGWEKIVLDTNKLTVAFTVPGMQLDFGGIGKGYAADQVIAVLKKHGITRALVAASGDITVMGTPPGKEGWRVEIAPLPDAKERYLILKDASVSTSGDAEQFVVIDGVRYSHILDPRTGLGLTGQRSVTVIAPNGITADSLTKVASILPPDKAVKVIDSLEGAATLISSKNGKDEIVYKSTQFDSFLEKKK